MVMNDNGHLEVNTADVVKPLKSLSVSIVIPVYNEAEHLAGCLDAISRQTIAPLEVIVVDNNSIDNTREIAAKYSFVKVISEKKQGVVYARSAGFDYAMGEIIGRIDADTIISNNWVETIKKIFSDSAVDAVSGSVYYYDLPTPKLSGFFDLLFRQHLANQLGDEVFLFGSNMAMKKTIWNDIRTLLCNKSGIHEDFDMAIHAEEQGAKVVFDASMKAAISLRRFDGNIKDFWQYATLSPLTYAKHGRTSQKHMYLVIFVVVTMHWFIRLNHLIYQSRKQKISLRRLLGLSHARVNPATFVE